MLKKLLYYSSNPSFKLGFLAMVFAFLSLLSIVIVAIVTFTKLSF